MNREFTLPLGYVENLPPADWADDCGFVGEKMTASHVTKSISELHPSKTWAFFPEMRIGTAYGKDNEQRLDAWAMSYYPSNDLTRIAYEIKVSRSDFLLELKNPAKRKQALVLSNRFYFAAPKGLIRVAELPAECGLVEILPNGRPHVLVHAPWRDAMPVSSRFLASVCRRVMEIEKRQSLLDARQEMPNPAEGA